MNITIFGASGRVGRITTQLAIERGHKVVAFTHSDNAIESAAVSAIKGDIHNAEDVLRALKNCDAVISTLGSWGTSQKDILSSATRHAIPELERRRLRFVTLTGNIASPASEKKTLGLKVARLGAGIFASKIIQDADDHLHMLEKSRVAWTSVRSPVMTNEPYSTYSLISKTPLSNLIISRKAVATALLDLVESQAWIGQAPTIVKR